MLKVGMNKAHVLNNYILFTPIINIDTTTPTTPTTPPTPTTRTAQESCEATKK